MKNPIFILFILFVLPAKGQFYKSMQDPDIGNFSIRNGKVFFQKSYDSGVNFESLEESLMKYNNPTGGFQVKKTSPRTMNGVLINFNLDWNYEDVKARKIAEFLKNPVNATFEVSKSGQSYQVTVNNIWFTDVKNPTNKRHETLESIALGKDAYVFTKNKKTRAALKMMDENFQSIFHLTGAINNNRF